MRLTLSQQASDRFRLIPPRSKPHRRSLTVCALTALLIGVPLYGHAETPLTGRYVWSSLSEVVTLVLAGPANGGLQGTIRDVMLNESGEETVVKGSLYGDSKAGRVMLHMATPPERPVFGRAPRTEVTISGHRNNNGTLYLRINGQKAVMRPATARQYQSLLNDLRVMGHLYRALRAQETLEANLRAFIYWGRQRLADRARVAAFYRHRVAYYGRCLTAVRKVANLGSTPGELSCVKSIGADVDSLNSERQMVLSWQPELARRTGTIEGSLQPVATRLKHWATLAIPASAYLSPDSGEHLTISRLDRALRDGSPASDFQSLKTYRSMVGKVRASIRTCAGIVREREPKLKALATEIGLINRATSSGFHS